MRSKRQPKPARPEEDVAGDPPSDASRLPNGQWADGYCPNPKGRPPKAKPQPVDTLRRVMDKPMPKNSLASGMTMREALCEQLVKLAFKDGRLAMALLKLDLSMPEQAANDEAELPVSDEALRAIVGRLTRGEEPNVDDEGEEGGS